MTTALSAEVIEGEAVPVQSPPPGGMVTLFGSDDPAVVIEKATKVAKALMAVVKAQDLAVPMGQGPDFLKVEAWTLLGSMVGVFASDEWTRHYKNGEQVGWEARVQARTLGGALIGAAESMCTRDEKTTRRDGKVTQRWKGADEHALRSMAQTRAVSKALSMPLRFIAVLAGYSGTPYEEMQHRAAQTAGGGQQAPQRPAQRQDGAKPKGALCRGCETAGNKSKNGYPPKFWPGRATCDGGVVENGKWVGVNHQLPAGDVPDVPPVEAYDQTDVPF